MPSQNSAGNDARHTCCHDHPTTSENESSLQKSYGGCRKLTLENDDDRWITGVRPQPNGPTTCVMLPTPPHYVPPTLPRSKAQRKEVGLLMFKNTGTAVNCSCTSFSFQPWCSTACLHQQLSSTLRTKAHEKRAELSVFPSHQALQEPVRLGTLGHMTTRILVRV